MLESRSEAAVGSQTSADFKLNVTGSPNTNVWNKCSFQPLRKIIRDSAHNGDPFGRSQRVAAVIVAFVWQVGLTTHALLCSFLI